MIPKHSRSSWTPPSAPTYVAFRPLCPCRRTSTTGRGPKRQPTRQQLPGACPISCSSSRARHQGLRPARAGRPAPPGRAPQRDHPGQGTHHHPQVPGSGDRLDPEGGGQRHEPGQGHRTAVAHAACRHAQRPKPNPAGRRQRVRMDRGVPARSPSRSPRHRSHLAAARHTRHRPHAPWLGLPLRPVAFHHRGTRLPLGNRRHAVRRPAAAAGPGRQ